MNTKKLLVVGELNVDLILNDIAGFPKVGTEILANKMNLSLGSSSAIMASNISALGIDTSFCGMLGEDDFGSFVLQQLQARKVDTRFITTTTREKTGITVVMNYHQDRANVTYCGAMETLTLEDLPWEQLQEFSHFHLSNFFLQKGIRKDITEIFRRAKTAGLTTSLDLQVDPEEKWEFDYKTCLPFVDVFFPNEAEILALTGETSVEAALMALKPYAKIVALKLGEKGARLFTKEKDLALKPFLNKNFADAIGAGDSFNAGFLEKYLQGASLEDCLKNANLIGSLSTTQPGGTGAFTSGESIEQQKQLILKQQL